MPALRDLLPAVIAAIPPSLPTGTWVLVTASALIACGKPDELSSFYVYATGPQSPLTENEKNNLSRTLQDVLAKAWTLVGIPLVVIAAATLAKVEKENPPEMSQRWVPPQLTPETTAMGSAFMQRLYKDNLDKIFSTLGSNSPLVQWIDEAIVYGLFLADHRILSDVEAELVALICIMCQGLRAPTMWHLRGTRRLGVSEDDVEAVQKAVEMLAAWAGRNTEGWARAGDVRDEV
ncbi:hypothetical protein MMC07_008723 [Pseudocyphellaria aurata]|nr:hypothetical protein [Pseudocyphellaria aurata]